MAILPLVTLPLATPPLTFELTCRTTCLSASLRSVAHRQQHGRFASAADLAAIPGIGPATISKLQTRVQCSPQPVLELWEETLSLLERGKVQRLSGGDRLV